MADITANTTPESSREPIGGIMAGTFDIGTAEPNSGDTIDLVTNWPNITESIFGMIISGTGVSAVLQPCTNFLTTSGTILQAGTQAIAAGGSTSKLFAIGRAV